MLMYIFKNNTKFYNNYFKIFDVKKYKLKISCLILLILLINAMLSKVPYNYLQMIARSHKLDGFDNLYDYTIPIISSFMIIYVFYKDYTTEIYKLLTFYNRNTINYILLFRWLFYVLIFSIGSFVTGLIYYSNVSFLDITSLYLSIRFIPNILFLSSLVLLIMTVFKNVYAAILLLTSYSCVDYLSGGSIFKIFSIGAHANNFYYTISPLYYIINRIVLILLSCIFVFVSCKISCKI
ncbi:hypothetical protein ADU81_14050 [Clostridium botulinum]|nr:hypothetical protein ADU81_14050 [Clostridium botulinum]